MVVASLAAAVCCMQVGYAHAAASPPFGFVEFRARGGATTGHTLIAYGELTKSGFRYRGSFGLYPGTALADTPLAVVLVLPGYVGKDSEDEKRPARLVYRRLLSKRSYTHLLATLRRLRGATQDWHFVFYNCNDFAAIVAQSVGLRTPPSFELPEHFVRDLAIFNRPAAR